MAFPQIAAANGGADPSNTTSHPISLPAGIQSGDLLLVLFANTTNAAVTGWPTGYVSLIDLPGTNVSIFARYKICDGSESGFSLSTAGSLRATHTTYRITGWHGTTPPEVATPTAQLTSTTPDPPSLDPGGWASEDTLWLAVAYVNNGTTTVSSYPASYTNGRLDATGATAGSVIATARRELAAGSDDPGTFTISATRVWRATTVAVRPAAVAGITGTLAQPLDAATSTAAGTVVTPTASGTLTATLGAAGVVGRGSNGPYDLVATVAGSAPDLVSGFTTAAIDTTGANLLILAYVTDASFLPPAFSDSKGNTWTAGGNEQSPDGGQNVRFYHVAAPTVGAGHTWTVTGLGASLLVLAVKGAHTAPADGETGAGTTVAPSLSPGTLTPSLADSLLVTVVSPFHAPTIAVLSIDAGFAIVGNLPHTVGGYPAALAYLIQDAAAPVNPTWTFSTSGSAAARLAAFKPAVAAPVSGTLARTLAGLSLSAAGTAPAQGTLTKALAGVMCSATAQAAGTGTLTQILTALTGGATGTVLTAGTLTRTLDGLTLVATGTALTAGTLTRTLAPVTLTATGTVVAVGAISGSLTQTLAGLSVSAVGTVSGAGVSITGTLSQALGGVTLSAAAASTLTATLARTLAPLTLAATGTSPLSGTLAQTLAGVTLTAMGAVPGTGTLTQTLDAVLGTATGRVAVTAILTRTLATVMLTATGTTQPVSHGTLAQTLDALTLEAAGLVAESGLPPDPLEEQILAAIVGRLRDMATVLPGCWYPPRFVARAYRPLDGVNELPGYLVLRAPEESGAELQTLDYPGSAVIAAMGVEILAYGQGNDLEPTDRVLTRLLAQAERVLCAPGLFGAEAAPENQIELVNTRRVLDHETDVGPPYRSLMSHLYRVRYLYTRGEPTPALTFPAPTAPTLAPDPLPEPIEEQILTACVARLTDIAAVVPACWYPPKFVARTYRPLDAVNELPGYLVLRAPEESAGALDSLEYPDSAVISTMGLEVLAYAQGSDQEPTDRVLLRLLAQAETALCAPGLFGPDAAPENQIELQNTRRVLDHETEVGAPYRSLMSHLYRVRYLGTRGHP